jgi:hypothetical protein
VDLVLTSTWGDRPALEAFGILPLYRWVGPKNYRQVLRINSTGLARARCTSWHLRQATVVRIDGPRPERRFRGAMMRSLLPSLVTHGSWSSAVSILDFDSARSACCTVPV